MAEEEEEEGGGRGPRVERRCVWKEYWTGWEDCE